MHQKQRYTPVAHRLQDKVAVTTSEVLFRRTGRQFFLADAPASSGMANATSSARRRSSSAIAATNASAAMAGGEASSSAPTASSAAAAFEPLVVRLSRDDPDAGRYYWSALRAFDSRCDNELLL